MVKNVRSSTENGSQTSVSKRTQQEQLIHWQKNRRTLVCSPFLFVIVSFLVCCRVACLISNSILYDKILVGWRKNEAPRKNAGQFIIILFFLNRNWVLTVYKVLFLFIRFNCVTPHLHLWLLQIFVSFHLNTSLIYISFIMDVTTFKIVYCDASTSYRWNDRKTRSKLTWSRI